MAAKKDTVSLAAQLSKKAQFRRFSIWLVGDTPLIVHAWSEKARREMLEKQVKAVKASGKTARDPVEDFKSSLYEMGDGKYGFPVSGVKNCILSASHKDKGIPRTTVMQALWLDAQMIRVGPAKAGAICDMPLTRIYGSDPEMREDMVKIGAGMNKTANLAYRGQFTHWALKITGKFKEDVLSADTLAFLIQEAGLSFGLGEWRNERRGVFGSFHLADEAEEKEWEAFAAGNGQLPISAAYQMQEAAE